jgi:hypothetical protein
MIIVWAVFVFLVNNAPGLVHLLLTLGLFIVIWRIVARVKLPSSTKRSQ